MASLKIAAASVEVPADVHYHSFMGFDPTDGIDMEAPLRASAIIIDADVRACIISCDAIGLTRDICDNIINAVESRCGIPCTNILVSATHTHHAPMTVSMLGINRDENYVSALSQAAIEAVSKAFHHLTDDPPPGEVEAEMFFTVGNEATVGKNSRFILRDGGIMWLDHKPEELVRPTGPMNPDIPFLAFRRPDGSIIAAIISHANHNIGFKEKPVSPGFYGLAVREAEKAYGGTFIFLPGAFGSTHPLDLPVEERIIRVGNSINEVMLRMREGLFGPVSCYRTPFRYSIRRFDEAAEDAAVAEYCHKYLDDRVSNHYINVFREMRKELAPCQGEERESIIQVIRVGDVAIVGVPGELFTLLGLEIERRSPFRYTIVTAIANDYIGYLPDRQAFEYGGYQTWVGLQSLAEKGTGEAIVDAAVDLLDIAYSEGRHEPIIREVTSSDALPLQIFYNSLDHEARVTFRSMGWTATFTDFKEVVNQVLCGTRYDVVIEQDGRILGWAYIAGLDQEYPVFGIGVSKELRGRGFGRRIMERVIDFGRRNRINKGIDLTVVQTNAPALNLYKSMGFQITGTVKGDDGLDYYSMRLSFDDPTK